MADTMKALTVQQPWAWAIIQGGKNVENRTQLWKYRGPLAIHAGLSWADNGERDHRVRGIVADHIVQADENAARDWLRNRKMPRDFMAFGAIIGTVDLVDIHTATEDCYFAHPCYYWGDLHDGRDVRGRFQSPRRITHLVLENPRPLADPIPCKGALGLWTPPADVLERLSAVSNG